MYRVHAKRKKRSKMNWIKCLCMHAKLYAQRRSDLCVEKGPRPSRTLTSNVHQLKARVTTNRSTLWSSWLSIESNRSRIEQRLILNDGHCSARSVNVTQIGLQLHSNPIKTYKSHHVSPKSNPIYLGFLFSAPSIAIHNSFKFEYRKLNFCPPSFCEVAKYVSCITYK